jgi:predicted RND superfamily exporter protein
LTGQQCLFRSGRQRGYGQIGLVLLIGLAAKNAILIVEFAKDRLDRGVDVRAATEQAAEIRYRPVMMTALAFIVGVIPLLIASGAGAVARQSIGRTVFGGMVLRVLSASCLYLSCSSRSNQGRSVRCGPYGEPTAASHIANETPTSVTNFPRRRSVRRAADIVVLKTSLNSINAVRRATVHNPCTLFCRCSAHRP